MTHDSTHYGRANDEEQEEDAAESSIIIHEPHDADMLDDADVDTDSQALATAATEHDDHDSSAVTPSAVSTVETTQTTSDVKFTLHTPVTDVQQSMTPHHDTLQDDDSDLGIPSYVILDGKRVEMTDDMDILEKVDLVRRERAEEAARRRAAREGTSTAGDGDVDADKRRGKGAHPWKSLSDIV